MAASFVLDHGGVQNKTTQSGTNLAPAATVAVGNTLVILAAGDGANISGIADPTSNVWAEARDMNNPGGVRVQIWYCDVENELNEFQTITVSWATDEDAKAIRMVELSGVATGGPFSNNGTTGTGTASSTNAVTIPTDGIGVAVVGWEGPSGDSAGSVAGFTNIGEIGTSGGGATGNITQNAAYKLTSGSSNYNPTLSTSRDWAGAIVAWDPGGPAATNFQPAPVAVTLAVVAPTLATSLSLTPAPVVAVTAVPAPEVGTAPPTELTPGPVPVSLAVPGPTLALSLGFAPAPVAVTLAVPAPTLVKALSLQPVPVPVVLAVPAPALVTPLSLAPAPVAAVLGVPAPALDTPVSLAPAPVPVILAVPLPTISSVSTTELTPDPVAVQLAVPGPTLDTPLALAPAPVPVALAVPVSLVQTALSLAPAPVAVQLQVPAALISTVLALAPSPVPIVLAVPSSVIAQDIILSPDPVVVQLTLGEVTVIGESRVVVDALLMVSDKGRERWPWRQRPGIRRRD